MPKSHAGPVKSLILARSALSGVDGVESCGQKWKPTASIDVGSDFELITTRFLFLHRFTAGFIA